MSLWKINRKDIATTIMRQKAMTYLLETAHVEYVGGNKEEEEE